MIKALIFDLNGTVIDICTSESDENIYRTVANFLEYHGVKIAPEELKEGYYNGVREQKENSSEEFPEFDAVRIFHDIIMERHALDEIAAGKAAVAAAQLFRAASLRKLVTYPGVQELLPHFKLHYQLAAVSDGQSAWAVPELRRCQLDKFFSGVTVSGDLGFRKPDRRIFGMALKNLQLTAEEVIFVGNDMYRDIYGAHNAGMKTVFFKSNQGDQEFRQVEADYIIYDFRELPNALEFLS